ncbi:hypothetical protein GOA77_03515 [Sinorhizobium meliloti]|uniref:hypothetical protein n=3 Tax=Rhizobium meliloti TaxID=382 RepID=UPI0001E4DD71|nr:hypothetical protein [Sinorhizobium meliloti]AEG09146.1 exported protein, glycine-rich [Sinorhizobium meliloti BL225C]ASP55591.1 hypothetical protein CDO31_30210 [Sinorhizobium meliloti]ASP75505.1 hypothetical protein CDO28_29510 [Sinorhizobium meliloti]ASP87932.1 hypothetical protein CDO26_26475 [Sinorhizobium meliloti]MDE3859364.1 hypothetical protein [Sinorhizobium meliloti]
MVTRRNFLAALCWVSVGLPVAVSPYKIALSGSGIELEPQSALAKGGGSGGGRGGGGGGGGRGGGNGNGRGGGSNGKGGGNSNSGRASGRAATSVEGGGSILRVRHRDGISEVIEGARYIMKDSRGRTIVNRRATSADRRRLLSFID